MKTNNTALLVMDMQDGILAGYSSSPHIVPNVAKAIEKARSKGLKIIYVHLRFNEGMPELNLNNKGFATIKGRFENMSMDAFSKIDARITPLAGDILVAKRRFSAFTGSELEVVLRAQGIQHLVLTGVSTSGVVLSTTREAADKDYTITILSDCCGDGDEEVHRVLTTKVFPKQADVLTVDEW